jgi:hypothetical protein
MLRKRIVKGAERMKAKILLITAIMFASLFVITALPVGAEPNYEQTKYDPQIMNKQNMILGKMFYG